MLHLSEARRLSPGGWGSVVLPVPTPGNKRWWREVNLQRRLRLSVRRNFGGGAMWWQLLHRWFLGTSASSVAGARGMK